MQSLLATLPRDQTDYRRAPPGRFRDRTRASEGLAGPYRARRLGGDSGVSRGTSGGLLYFSGGRLNSSVTGGRISRFGVELHPTRPIVARVNTNDHRMRSPPRMPRVRGPNNNASTFLVKAGIERGANR